jgi:hypothetical protein
MTHSFTSEISDAVEADLTSVYKNKLSTYNRTLLYTKTGPVFLFDQIESNSKEGHVYDWLFHAPLNSIQYEKQRVRIDRPSARLTLDVISPEIVDHNIRNNAPDHESFITLSSADNLTETNFLAVMLPEAKPEGKSYGPRPITKKIKGPGWMGAKVEYNNNLEGFTTDAKRFTATFSNRGTLERAYFEGKHFSGPQFSVKSDHEMTLAADLDPYKTELVVAGKNEATLELKLKKPPTEIRINGSLDSSWKYREGSLIISVKKGKNNVSIQK